MGGFLGFYLGQLGKAFKRVTSEVFKGLGKLRHVNLSNNKLTYPKIFALRSLKNLRSIDIRGNPLECLPKLPEMEPKINAEWSEEGPFFWDGGELEECAEAKPRGRKGGDRRLETMMA